MADTYEDLCQAASKLVKSEYREDYLKMVRYGELTERFSAYLEKDKQARKAVDIAVDTASIIMGFTYGVSYLPSAPKKWDKVNLLEAMVKLIKD